MQIYREGGVLILEIMQKVVDRDGDSMVHYRDRRIRLQDLKEDELQVLQ